MIRPRLALAVAVGLTAVGWAAVAASSPSVRLLEAPKRITLGQTWNATLRTVGTGTPVVTARLGTARVTARAHRVERGRFRVALRLGAIGTWRIAAAFAGRLFRLGSVSVRAAAPYALDNPAQVLIAPDRALLVTERGARNRILRVEPATGEFSVFATGVPSPWGLGYAPDGSLLVSSTSGLYRILPGKRPTRMLDVSVSPFVVMPDGGIAFANETSVGVIARGLLKPYALTRANDGTLYVTEAGDVTRATGALRRVSPDGAVTTIRLRQP